MRLMLLDGLMPEFDATRIEHRVIDGRPSDVYEAAIHVDFLDAVRRSRIVRGLFALRGAAERVAATARGSQAVTPSEPFALRLAEMPEHGGWVRLGEDPPNEFVFGVIGRFWGGETTWNQIDASAFRSFDRPGYAKIAANLSLRVMGTSERCSAMRRARRPRTKPLGGRSCGNWAFASPGAGVVMRSLLSDIAQQSRGPG